MRRERNETALSKLLQRDTAMSYGAAALLVVAFLFFLPVTVAVPIIVITRYLHFTPWALYIASSVWFAHLFIEYHIVMSVVRSVKNYNA